MLIAALPCLTDVSVEPQHSTGGRTKSQVCKSSSSTSAICRRLFHHNTGFVFHTCSQLSKKPAELCSPHARSPWDENLGLSRLLHLPGQMHCQLPHRPLNKDAAQQSSFHGLHGFASLQKQITSHHLCLGTPLSFTVRQGTTCAALASAAAHRRNSTESGWCKWKIAVSHKMELGAVTEGLGVQRAGNKAKAPYCLVFSGTENSFHDSTWQLSHLVL